MSKLSTGALIFLSTTLALTGVSCSSDKPTTEQRGNAQPIATTSVPKKAEVEPLASPVPEKVVPDGNYPNPYELALDKAYSALSISQSAQSADDWHLVVSQWMAALALLKAVPASSPYKALAQSKIAEYERQLRYAAGQATRRIPATGDSSVVTIIPIQPQSASGPAAVESPPSMLSQQVFQAPIKRRAGGTPVIDVTFNGSRQFEMIVDTGASGTVITQQAAAALGVVPVAKAKANTASARAVEFPIGYVNSIEVAGTVVKDVPVAIAPSLELETGLLGHDFFGNYDVTIKRDVVEFRSR